MPRLPLKTKETVARLIRRRLKELDRTPEMLATAVQVPEWYVDDLLSGSRRPDSRSSTYHSGTCTAVASISGVRSSSLRRRRISRATVSFVFDGSRGMQGLPFRAQAEPEYHPDAQVMVVPPFSALLAPAF